jgi:hypothetical protein
LPRHGGNWDRATVLTLEGMIGSQHEYITWLVNACMAEKAKLSEILTIEAIELLSEKLRKGAWEKVMSPSTF